MPPAAGTPPYRLGALALRTPPYRLGMLALRTPPYQQGSRSRFRVPGSLFHPAIK